MVSKSLNDNLHAEVSAIREIVQSPYEGNRSAEVGEHLFEYTRSLMDPEEGLSSAFRESETGPSDEANEVFGKERAHTILDTVRSVSSSGILYGYGWIDGIIQQRHCGKLDKELLLLCLHDHRFARAPLTGIKQVIKDLGGWEILSNAMSQWKLAGKFPRLARCKSIASFKQKQLQCLKCILFIARAVICMKYLEWDFLDIADDTSLKTKVYACFHILENLVTIQEKKIAKKKAPTQKPAFPMDLDSNESTHNSLINEKKSAHHHKDLSGRFRSKQRKIKPVRLDPALEQKEPRKSDRTKENSDGKSKRKRSFEKISSVGLRNKGKKQKESSSHVFFEITDTSLSNKSAEIPPHALFDMKSNRSQVNDETKIVDVPKTIALSMNQKMPSYVSDGSSLHSNSSTSSNSSHPNFWYPVNSKELILNPIQIEMAWLTEESTFCSRKTDVDWIFMMKYASPSLAVQLRNIPCYRGDVEDMILANFFQNGIERKRFENFRREVRRKLLKNVVRMRMKGILPRLRRATHPLLLQKKRLKKMAEAAAEIPHTNEVAVLT